MIAGAFALGAVGLLAGCGGSNNAGPAPTEVTPLTGTATSPPAGSATSSSPASTPTVSPGGSTPVPTATARPKHFSQTVTYNDGVKVSVVKAVKGKVTATGPGEVTGSPYVTFTVRFVNDTAAKLNLQHVLVLATYGAKHTAANPVYNGNVHDFATVVKAGDTAQTRYQFGIPASALGDVRLTVRFDSGHSTALFDGPVAITAS